MSIDELRNRVYMPPTPQASEIEQPRPGAASRQKPVAGEPEFGAILRGKMAKATPDIRFSAHAAERLAARNISLSEGDMVRLSDAIDKVANKGGRESLMVLDGLAFVVSVPNKTVITAMDANAATDDRIFTNIDSAMFVGR